MKFVQDSERRTHARLAAPHARNRLRKAAARALAATIEASARDYDRDKALAPFYRLSRATIDAETVEAAQEILREIGRALRSERARMRHWSYDLNRHIGLTIAYRCEKSRAQRIARRSAKYVEIRAPQPRA